jgi:hypothetical protein
MSVDLSRITFQPWKDYLGVIMQQGRVQLDADWNEWVAELARRLQAGTMDTLGPAEAGRAVVPSTTPSGFEILAAPGGFTIGVGRVYVDGILVENHGVPPTIWDPRLAEVTGTAAISFFEQPYLPFNDAVEDPPADVFNRPVLAGGPHLVYLDVWQREVTYLEDPELVEKAVGVDTTARLQTVWQVRVLQNPGAGTACATDDDDIPGWPALIQPSGARLTTSTGALPDDPNPCLVPPAAGYKGTENQLYRVEIHRGGPQATATFKWSRDNATVATRVTEIHGGTRLVVESLGRDDVLGFHPGDWIEIVDDWHELHGRPGLLRRIRPGDGIVPATRSILFDDALPAGLFPVDGQGRTDATRHTRIRRWDQSNQVRRADGTVFHNLNASASSNGIPVPAPGISIALEHGILVEFDLAPGAEYRTGDYWTVTARAADGSIDLLDEAPPRGIHHHYARLAVVTLPGTQEDCRIHWPPSGGGESCDCTVCVHAEAHNAGTATIQQAIDAVRTRGGTVCLDAGTYLVNAPLNLDGARSVRIRGQGWRTLLQAGQGGGIANISRATGVAIENLAMVGAATGAGTTALIGATHCIDLQLSHLVVAAVGAGDATAAAVGLSGISLGCTIRDCTLVAEQGVIARHGEPNYLLTANLRVTDSLLFCSQRGVRFDGATLHYGEVRIAGNLILACSQAGVTVTGASLPNAAVTIDGNVMQVSGAAIRAGVDGLRILDNELVSAVARAPVDGIAFEPGFDTGAIDRAMVTGNRIREFGGNGIAIRHTLGDTMIKSNVIEEVGLAAITMEDDASASYLCIENNHFRALGAGFNEAQRPFFGVHLLGAARADVIANVFANVARSATQSTLRAALAVQASAEVRVAGNRMFGIGPVRFVGRTIGIAVAANFRQLAVDDNAVARVATSDETPDPAAWQAIVIAGAGRTPGAAGGGIIITPGVIIAPAGEAAMYLSAFRVGLLPARQGTVSARGNRLRSQLTGAPTIDIDDVIACLLSQNDAEATGAAATGAPAPVARIQCRHASASGNRLIGTSDLPTFVLTAPQFAVVANITSGPIQVNGSGLPAPWNALNVPA